MALDLGKRSLLFSLEVAGRSTFGFLVLAFAARSTSLDMFGAFALVISVASIQQTLAAFGIHQIIYGRAALRPNARQWLGWMATRFTANTSVAMYVLTSCLFWFIGGFDIMVLYLLAGTRVLGALGLPAVSDAEARGAVHEYIPLRLFTLSSGLLACMVAWWLQAPIVVFAAIWGLETLFYSLVITVAAHQRGRLPRVRARRRKVLLITAAPIALQSFFIAVYTRFDQIYIAARFGDESLAIYAAAARIAELANLASAVTILLFAPRLIQEIRTSQKISNTLLLVFLAISSASAVACLAALGIGPTLLAFVFGPQFSLGAPILAVYLLSTALVAYGGFASRTLASRSITTVQVWSGFAGAGANVVLTILLSEFIGPIGAAYATVAAYAIAVAILWRAIITKLLKR